MMKIAIVAALLACACVGQSPAKCQHDHEGQAMVYVRAKCPAGNCQARRLWYEYMNDACKKE